MRKFIKRVFCVAVAAVFIWGSVLSVEAAATGTVSGSSVNVREKPSISSSVLDQLIKGTKVVILDSQDGWYRVRYLNLEGWVSSEFISASATTGQGKITAADVNVIALIGERGREVREFIEKDLGPQGLERSVVVVATSDKPALVRIQGALVAISIAEYFRDKGLDVLFMMDSLTRFSLAQREVGLAIGEPPTTRGYTPSVFALLPRFLERAGTTGHQGSITGLYTVLVEQDDMNDPIADASRAILDGHIVLSRTLAERNHYPPIDLLQSISRLMVDVVSPDHLAAARRLQEILAVYRKAEDLVNIGAYQPGSNPAIDRALKYIDPVNRFLKQDRDERATFGQTLEELLQLVPQE